MSLTNPTLRLLDSCLLPDFPSGSSINYYNGSLFLVGDDAANTCILDTNYTIKHFVRLFDSDTKRISKAEKSDLEASVIIPSENGDSLILLGSASTEKRRKLITIPLLSKGREKDSAMQVYDLTELIQRLLAAGIAEINLEGLASYNGGLILANRGNRTHQQNHLIFTDRDFWTRQGAVSIEIKQLALTHLDAGLGVSEVCYYPPSDLLLLTFTSENTSNSYDDGEIGASFIGIITSLSTRLSEKTLEMEYMLSLPEADPSFNFEKIEGICVEDRMENGSLILHLVSDNDSGCSRLFKARLTFQVDR
jgi:hypothetical protein